MSLQALFMVLGSLTSELSVVGAYRVQLSEFKVAASEKGGLKLFHDARLEGTSIVSFSGWENSTPTFFQNRSNNSIERRRKFANITDSGTSADEKIITRKASIDTVTTTQQIVMSERGNGTIGRSASSSLSKGSAVQHDGATIEMPRFAKKKHEFLPCLQPTHHARFKQLHNLIGKEFDGAIAILNHIAAAKGAKGDPALLNIEDGLEENNPYTFVCRLLLMSALAPPKKRMKYTAANKACQGRDAQWMQTIMRKPPMQEGAGGEKFDPDTEQQLDGWAAAMFIEDLETAKAIKAELVSKGIDPARHRKPGSRASAFLETFFEKFRVQVKKEDEQIRVVYLLGPSASGKSFFTSENRVGGKFALAIDGDYVRDASANYQWLIGLQRLKCPYKGYDVWLMQSSPVWKGWQNFLTYFNAQTTEYTVARKSSKVKRALQAVAERAGVNLVKPETATEWGIHLKPHLGASSYIPGARRALKRLGGKDLEPELREYLDTSKYELMIYAAIAPKATTWCDGVRRSKKSWKPYTDSGWIYSVAAVAGAFERFPDNFQSISIRYIKGWPNLAEWSQPDSETIRNKQSEYHWLHCYDQKPDDFEFPHEAKMVEGLKQIGDPEKLFHALAGVEQTVADSDKLCYGKSFCVNLALEAATRHLEDDDVA